jgi:hypothetical protein
VYLSILACFPKKQDISLYMIKSLEKILVKESNEAALMGFLLIFVEHSESAFSQGEISFAKILLEGIQNQKLSIRIIYYNICVKLHRLNLNFGSYRKTFSEKMLQTVVDVQKFGIALLDPKIETSSFMEGFLAVAFLVTDQKVPLPEIVQKSDCFLFNQKFYSKFLVTKEEFTLYLDTISKILSNPSCCFTDISQSICQTIIRVVISSPSSCYRDQLKLVNQIVLHSSVQVELVKTLHEAVGRFILEYTSNQVVGESLAWPIAKVRSSNILGVRISDLIQSFLPPPPLSDELQRQLLQMVILLAHPLVSDSVGIDFWIRLCYRFRITPIELLEKFGVEQIQLWMNESSSVIDGSLKNIFEKDKGLFRKSVLSSISLFTEMKPAMICEILIPQCLPLLTGTIQNISSRDIKIWSLPEGEVYETAIVPSKQDVPKNADEKWDMELKKELQRKGQKKPVKTTKQEKSLILETLKAESERRKLVEISRNELILALDVIDAIIKGILLSLDIDVKNRFFVHLKSVLGSLVSHLHIVDKLYVDQESTCTDAILNGSRSVELLREVYQLFQNSLQPLKVDDIYSCIILTLNLEKIGKQFVSSKQKQNYSCNI